MVGRVCPEIQNVSKPNLGVEIFAAPVRIVTDIDMIDMRKNGCTDVNARPCTANNAIKQVGDGNAKPCDFYLPNISV